MRPLNEAERSKNIWKFLGIFLLALLPILFVVYQFARVDATENRYLIEKQLENSSEKQQSEYAIELRGYLQKDIEKLASSINAISRSPFDASAANDIEDYIETSNNNIALLQIEMPNDLDREYTALLSDLNKALKRLNNDVYARLYERHQSVVQKLEQCEAYN